MSPLHPPTTPSVLRRSLGAAGSLALTLMVALPAATQERDAGLGCGARPGGEYAVVLDASTSLLRPSSESKEETEASYVEILERLAGVLCRRERLMVYPMVRNDTTLLIPVDSVHPGAATRERLRGVVQKALRHGPSHSDFLLVVNRTRTDVLARPGLRAAFFLTDGSFYPYRVPAARDQRLQTVIDRLTDLERVVTEMQRDGAPFYVIGIRAGQASAVDPHLDFTWPDSAQRIWRHGSGSRDLKGMKGDALLATLFGTSFVPGEQLNLWPLLVGAPASPWQRLLGYSNGWTRTLPELRTVRMEHLMFVPADGAGSTACHRVRHGPLADTALQPVQPVPIGSDRYACSLEHPTQAELDSIAARGVSAFAFHQSARFHPADDPAPLYGLHELVLSVDGSPCPEWMLSRDFLQSTHSPGGDAVSRLELVPLSGRPTNDTASMMKKASSPCIVPNVPAGAVSERQGDYLLFLSDTAGAWVHRRTFELPRLQLASLIFRPGGFPFPPNRLALLGVCINSTEPIRPGEKLLVELGGETHELDDAARADCPTPRPGTPRPYAYGFRGVILLESTALSSARIGIVPGGLSSGITARGRWLPVALKANGTWFLSNGWLVASALLGALAQVLYLRWFVKVRFLSVPMRRRVSLAVSVIISSILAVVFAECCVMVTQSPLESSAIPIPFALVVLAHGLKLVAAALLPEIVENTLLAD